MDKKVKVFSVLFTICLSAGIYIVGYLLALAVTSYIPGLCEQHMMYRNAIAMATAAFAVVLTIPKSEYSFRIERKPALSIIAVIILAYATSALFNVLLGLIPWQDIFTQDVTPSEEVFYGIPLWARMICYEMVAPISEELLFRQVIYKRIRTIGPLWLAVGISALLFGIYHGNPVQGLYAVIMGIFLALVYEWTGSLVAPIVFHMIANHLSDIAYEFEMVGTVVYSWYGIPVSALLACAALVILIKNKNKCSENGLQSE